MSQEVPTLYEWLGGAPALERLLTHFYALVGNDPLIAPLFAGMSPDHVAHVSAFIGEVFGGPKAYSADHGGHAAMLRHHIGKHISEAQRARWMQLLLESADTLGVPSDPEFRSAFVAYIEWGTRLAVINSQPDAQVDVSTPMPIWGWGEAKGPYLPPTSG